MSNSTEPVLIGGTWRASVAADFFQPLNPASREELPHRFPVSPWDEVEEAVLAAWEAFQQLRGVSPDAISQFLESYAARIDARREELVASAVAETGLPAEPRLNAIELPRTTDQLRQAAGAARERSWSSPTIDTQNNIRSMLRGLGPVCVFGPNNFPFAFNSVAGGDFAAAVAAGNPVIAKANSSHPRTSQLLAEEARMAAGESGMPSAMVQLIYRTSHDDGARMVAHPRVGATAYTGSRRAGLFLKGAADKPGNPIYLELSSVNPVVMLPAALRERSDDLLDEYVGSVLMGAGQFCTNPGILFLLGGARTDAFIEEAGKRFQATVGGTLLSEGVERSLEAGIGHLREAGAEVVATGQRGTGCSVGNTLLRATGGQFLNNPSGFQEEAFGNAGLIVVADDEEQLKNSLELLEGNLTGCIYSHYGGNDDALYAEIESILRHRVGRLLNDKMPTGVAVSPAMNHGGPYPSTGHSGFTAVGIPGSMRRFGALQCYDNVREKRLPEELKNRNPTGVTWRSIDGEWTQGDVL